MDFFNLLPHVIWAVAAVVAVHKLVDWLKGADTKKAVASVRAEVTALESMLKLTMTANLESLQKLERRIEPLERVPARKVQF